MTNHDPTCRSWMPEARPCNCEGLRSIIVAPTHNEAIRYAISRDLGPRHTVAIFDDESTARLRGMRWPFPGYRLEIIGYPDNHATAAIIRGALLHAQVPVAEVYENTPERLEGDA